MMKDRYLYKAKTADGNWVTGMLSYFFNQYYISNEAGRPLAYRVDENTICQCTGYKGIYEKDIFQCDDERYVIEWCDSSLSWDASAVGSSESISLGEFSPDEIIVIGNAIDNPELLEA